MLLSFQTEYGPKGHSRNRTSSYSTRKVNKMCIKSYVTYVHLSLCSVTQYQHFLGDLGLELPVTLFNVIQKKAPLFVRDMTADSVGQLERWRLKISGSIATAPVPRSGRARQLGRIVTLSILGSLRPGALYHVLYFVFISCSIDRTGKGGGTD
jgi:hypothetical protein